MLIEKSDILKFKRSHTATLESRVENSLRSELPIAWETGIYGSKQTLSEGEARGGLFTAINQWQPVL